MEHNIHALYSEDVKDLKEEDYIDVLAQIQKYFSENHTALYNNENLSNEDYIMIQKKLIMEYLLEHKLEINHYSKEQLCDKIYNDMAGFGVLNDLIYQPGTHEIISNLEEVNINSWEDIEVIYHGHAPQKTKYKFNSAEDAKNMFDRILAINGVKIDILNPSLVTYLPGGIRICVNQYPIVSKSDGISASIRIVNPNTLTVKKIIEENIASKEMMDLIYLLHCNGISIAFSGGTSTGKTTFASAVLKAVPDDKRIVIVEEGTKEINVVKRDKDGNILNSVVSLMTRPHVKPEYNITASKLIERALTMNPDYIVIAEMKGEESVIAAEAAITGQVGITTIHANEAYLVYERMVDLALKKYPTATKESLMHKMVNAFPIVVQLEMYPDRARRVCEIVEAVGVKDDKPIINTLYRYDVNLGKHIKCSNISAKIQTLLAKKGVSKEEISRIQETEGEQKWI